MCEETEPADDSVAEMLRERVAEARRGDVADAADVEDAFLSFDEDETCTTDEMRERLGL